MFNGLLARIEALWQHLERAGAAQPGVLAVMPTERYFTQLSIFAVQEGWSIRFAGSLESAMQACRLNNVRVILYDRDLPGVDWRRAFHLLLHSGGPVCCVLLSSVIDRRLRKAVLDSGGYDVARKPLDPGKPLEREQLVRMVNGSLALQADIDSCTTAALA